VRIGDQERGKYHYEDRRGQYQLVEGGQATEGGAY
jgi:hypothetical protein